MKRSPRTRGREEAAASADPVFAEQFAEVCAFVGETPRAAEVLFAQLRAERADYVRFDRAKVRQAGTVESSQVTLHLIDGGRQARFTCTIGVPRRVRATLAAALAALREVVAHAPADPYAHWQAHPGASEYVAPGRVVDAHEAITAIVEAVGGDDVVGLYAAGPVVRGLAGSPGHRHYHQGTPSSFDFSVHAGGDRAVKETWSSGSWDARALGEAIAAARARARLLCQPARRIEPGVYRALLSPRAVAELVRLLGWGGFSERAQRSGQSSLVLARGGRARFHPGFSIVEDAGALAVPRFQSEGFERPERVPLIVAGEPAERLVSARSAREFGLATNGADDDERPLAPCVAPGELASSTALDALGTGLAVADLWYLNYSDRGACRVTGLTRHATLWVEDGQPVGPVETMRVDDSLYRVFGDRLLGLGDVALTSPESATWHGREPGGVRAPAALVGALRLTL